MKIGLIADIHSNIFGLEACLENMQVQNVSEIFCAGDIVGYYPFVNDVIDLLKKYNIKCISGNHDSYLLQYPNVDISIFNKYALDHAQRIITSDNYRFLSTLPPHMDVEYQGVKLAMFHGSPWHPNEYIYPDYCQFDKFMSFPQTIVILGHTHYPMIKTVPPSTIVMNPGSCGQPRDGLTLASYATIDLSEQTIHIFRVPYDIPALAQATRQAGFPPANVDILYRRRGSRPESLFPQMSLNFSSIWRT